MKPFKLKYKSFWWYVLTLNDELSIKTVCDVPKNLFIALLVFSSAVIGSAVLVGISSPIIVFFDYFGIESLGFQDLVQITGITFYFVLFVCVVSIIVVIVANDSHKPQKEPSIISVWWKSFKEKTCVKIEIVDQGD